MTPIGATLIEYAEVRDVADPEAERLAEAGAYSRLSERIIAEGYLPTDGRYSTAAVGWHRAHGSKGWVRRLSIGWSPDDALRG